MSVHGFIDAPRPAAGIAFAIGFTLRVIALYRAREEPLAREPQGVYQHSDGRPMLGRKLKGKSERELRDLGLVVDSPGAAPEIEPRDRAADPPKSLDQQALGVIPGAELDQRVCGFPVGEERRGMA